jgi:hypothetical protein
MKSARAAACATQQEHQHDERDAAAARGEHDEHGARKPARSRGIRTVATIPILVRSWLLESCRWRWLTARCCLSSPAKFTEVGSFTLRWSIIVVLESWSHYHQVHSCVDS